MGHLREEIIIRSPSSRVWRIIEKHLEHPEVSSSTQDPSAIQEGRGEALSEQRLGVGTRTRWFYTYKGRPFVWNDVVTGWEPEKRVSWKTTSAWKMEDSFTLESAAGGTRLVYDMSYNLGYWLLGRLYGKVVLEPRMRKHLKRVLQRMRGLCENPLEQGSLQ